MYELVQSTGVATSKILIEDETLPGVKMSRVYHAHARLRASVIRKHNVEINTQFQIINWVTSLNIAAVM
jgi:hypothetical protein